MTRGRFGASSALRHGLQLVGLEPLKAWRAVVRAPYFVRTVIAYARLTGNSRFRIELRHLRPFLEDFDGEAGVASGHYFHQDLWAARKICRNRPSRHVDVGSRVDGFVAHLLTFMPVEVIDLRSLENSVEGLTFVRDDARVLGTLPDGSVESLSSLHAVEHVGLGRYGDPIDPEGWAKAMRALQRVLKPGGRLYLSVPVGRERLEFNAHRVFACATVLETLSDLAMVAFAAVDDQGRLYDPADPADFSEARYACGLFEFTSR